MKSFMADHSARRAQRRKNENDPAVGIGLHSIVMSPAFLCYSKGILGHSNR